MLIGVPHKYNYVVIAAKMYLICNQMQLQCVCGPNFGVYICDHLQENQALCDVRKFDKRLIFDS